MYLLLLLLRVSRLPQASKHHRFYSALQSCEQEQKAIRARFDRAPTIAVNTATE